MTALKLLKLLMVKRGTTEKRTEILTEDLQKYPSQQPLQEGKSTARVEQPINNNLYYY